MLNKVLLICKLTRPPELRYTPSGTAVADLRLAVNRNYTTQGGEKREETCFLTCVVWGKQAESCGGVGGEPRGGRLGGGRKPAAAPAAPEPVEAGGEGGDDEVPF